MGKIEKRRGKGKNKKMKITDDMIEDGIMKAIYHYRSKYKETNNEYWNDTAKMLEEALTEVTKYHMLRKNWFPGFVRKEG